MYLPPARFQRPEPSVIISRAPCILSHRDKRDFLGPLQVSPDLCTGCQACLRLGCPAINWVNEEGKTVGGKKRKGRAEIEKLLCPGCTLCAQVCKTGAIQVRDRNHGE